MDSWKCFLFCQVFEALLREAVVPAICNAMMTKVLQEKLLQAVTYPNFSKWCLLSFFLYFAAQFSLGHEVAKRGAAQVLSVATSSQWRWIASWRRLSAGVPLDTLWGLHSAVFLIALLLNMYRRKEAKKKRRNDIDLRLSFALMYRVWVKHSFKMVSFHLLFW